MQESLKQRTAKGLFWGAMNSGTTQILNLVFGIFLARLLSPEDYGIIGVLTIFTAIAADLQSSGFTQALVNIKKPTARDYNSVFSFNVLMSTTMYIILFLSAPLIALFFHQSCLVSVSRFVFLGFFIASLSIAHGGYMTKNMMNKEIAIIGVLALVSSGIIGITLAFLGYSYWALAWQQVTYITVTTICRYYYVKEWRPRLTMDFGPVRSMASFAIKILVTKIVNTTSGNILTVIFGHLFPLRAVGNYSQAFKWDTMAHSLISNTVGQVAQTVLVEADNQEQSADNRQHRVFSKMMRFTCFLAMPVMLGLALISREFIIITIGEGWIECVPLLQILCISGAFMPIYIMYQNLAISNGRSDIFMWLNLCQLGLQIAIVFTFHTYGMQAMVTAYTIFMILWVIPWQYFAGRLTEYCWKDLGKDVIPFVIATAASMIATYYITRCIDSPYILIIARIIIAAIIYYAIMKIVRVKILAECEHYVYNQLKR